MQKNFFSDVEAHILKDERFLYPDYIPERLPFRDFQINEIVDALKPVLRGAKPHNLFLFGPTGTGKTVTARFVLKELESYSSKAKGIYVNCFEFHTRNAVLNKLCISAGNPVPRRGLAADELYSEFIQTIKTKKIIPIVVFDEADRLIKEKTSSQLLYDLLRVDEQHGPLHIGIILISNFPDVLSLLDQRVYSSLSAKSVEFQRYTPEQLKQILEDRAKNAFFENALEKDVINLAAAYGAKCNGDARVAIEVLLFAARLAEKENAKQVTITHLKRAFENIKPRALQKAAPFLDEHEKKILKIVCEKGPIFSGELYKLYTLEVSDPQTERNFRDKVNRLAELKLLNVKEIKEGIRGKTRQISLAQPKEAVLKQLTNEGGFNNGKEKN
ncbi:MAG: AAA family ATPase [Candidatus Diapherotrites archaeon]